MRKAFFWHFPCGSNRFGDSETGGLAIAPELATGDGALGFWKALEEVFPTTRHQRCTVHKTANVLDELPTSVQTIKTGKSSMRR